LARALAGQERFRAAVAAVREAIRLDPDDHQNHELLSACRLAQGDWPGARASAERALTLAPESATARGLHARALAMTGDSSEELQASAAAALKADPGSSAVHALAAHAYLTGGREREAVAAFDEALRLDPESEYAQAGLAEALKAAHPLFRPLFRFFMWQERLSGGGRVAMYVVPLIATRLLRLRADNPIVLAVLIAWYAFVTLTWVATPLANVVLRLSPRGRAILPAAQKRSSSVFIALLGGAVLAVILAVVISGIFGATAIALVLLALSAGSGHGLSRRRRRAYEIALAIAVTAAFLGAVLISVGVKPGVILLLAAGLTGIVLLWIVRLS
jgi:hypothetical protein